MHRSCQRFISDATDAEHSLHQRLSCDVETLLAKLSAEELRQRFVTATKARQLVWLRALLEIIFHDQLASDQRGGLLAWTSHFVV